MDRNELNYCTLNGTSLTVSEHRVVPPETPITLGQPMELRSVPVFSSDFWAGLLTSLTISGLWR